MRMVRNCHKVKTDPAKTVEEIENSVTRIKWIYEFLANPEQTEDMGLE